MKKPATPGFWDTSALMLLICRQPLSAKARAAHRVYALLYVWWGTQVECQSALQRLIREKALLGAEQQQSFATLSRLSRQWFEILPTEDLRQQAERLLAAHPLRAADALQLAAALDWCNGFPKGRHFICADKNLSEAADKEGFTVTFLK